MSKILSVVAGVRGRDEHFRLFLKSLKLQTFSSEYFEIIVVNYGGSDITRKIIHQEEIKNIKYIYVPEFGIYNESRAKNIGIRNAQAEVVICTNCDIIYSPQVLEKFVDQIFKTKKKYLYQLTRYNLIEKTDTLKFLENLHNKGNQSDKYSLHYLSAQGDFQASQRKYWYKVRGYDERMLGWGRMDLDLAERMKLAGISQLWLDAKQIKIFHQHHFERAASHNDINYSLSLLKKSYIVNGPDWGREKKTKKIVFSYFNNISNKDIFKCIQSKEIQVKILDINNYRKTPIYYKNHDLNIKKFYNWTRNFAIKENSKFYIEVDDGVYLNKNLLKMMIKFLDEGENSSLKVKIRLNGIKFVLMNLFFTNQYFYPVRAYTQTSIPILLSIANNAKYCLYSSETILKTHAIIRYRFIQKKLQVLSYGNGSFYIDILRMTLGKIMNLFKK